MAASTRTSVARIAANRLNAQKSTGPKTERGKERSRANALKHGLTGEGIALPVEDAAAVEQRFIAVQGELSPGTVIGAFLAHKIALMTVRCQRAARQETAALASRIRRAAADFDEARAAEADHLLSWIESEPVTHRRKLLAMPEGVDRLIGALLGLRSDLERSEVRWNYVHGQKVEALFGRRECDIPRSRGIELSKAITGDFSLLDPAEVAHLATEPERRNWACDRMVEYIDAEVDRLRAHRETLDVEAIELDRAEAGERALFDAGKEATLARKYEAAATRELYHALREFREVEVASGSASDESPEVSEADSVVFDAGDSTVIAEAEADEMILDETAHKRLETIDLGAGLGSFGKANSDEPKPINRGKISVVTPSSVVSGRG